MLWKLRPGGQAGVVLANGSMSSNTGGEGQIREAMVRGDVVEVMVALPGRLFMNTTIPVCLWFLTNDKTMNGRDRRGETLFIDARLLGKMETRALKVFTDEDIAKIQNTVQSWKTGEGYEDVAGFCKSASLEDIEKNSFVLTPGRYSGSATEIDDGLPIGEKLDNLVSRLKDLQDRSKSLDLAIIKNVSRVSDA
jgi:type I restriction enzyme M protein